MKPVVLDDPKGAERERLQRLLGFKAEVNPVFDRFAKRIIEMSGGAIAGINHIAAGLRQFFPGMAVVDESGAIIYPPVELRRMGPSEGFCNYIAVDRKLPLPLNDLSAHPVFSTNPVTEVGRDEEGNEGLGLKAYLGAPLLTPAGLVDASGNAVPAGVTFGTVWVVDKQVQTWTNEHVHRMAVIAAEVVDFIVAQAVEDGLVSWTLAA